MPRDCAENNASCACDVSKVIARGSAGRVVPEPGVRTDVNSLELDPVEQFLEIVAAMADEKPSEGAPE